MNGAGVRRARLLLRDVSAALGFGTMAVSGELPGWAVAVALCACAVGLLGYRPLARLGTASALLLAAAAVLLYLPVATGRLDLVVAATTFAGLLAAQRLLVDPSPRTDAQVQLVSLLMACGGAALSGDLLYPLLLAGFCITSCGALALGVLEQAAGPAAEVTVRPAAQRVGAGVGMGLLAAAAFFVLFPRLSWSVAARHAGRGFGGTTGLSSSIRLGGGGGTIKTSTRTVARLTLRPDPLTPRLDRYFPGTLLSRFDGQSWEGLGKPDRSQGTLWLGDAKWHVQQEISLLPGYGGQVAVGLWQPVAFLAGTALRAGTQGGPVQFVHLPGREVRFSAPANGYTYTVLSVERPVEATEAEVEASRQLPSTLDGRIRGLAEQVLAGEREPRAAARKLEAWLKANHRYTLELPDAQGEDPLAHFLFERKAGHCEYFASALAVLLRSVGIPARVVVGFYGGTRNGDHYVLRAGDAHAWTEVHVPGEGFVLFDATPEAGRSSQGAAWLQSLVDRWEALEAWWSTSVLDYSLRDQFEFARKMLEPGPRRSGSAAPSALPAGTPRAVGTLAAGLLVFWLVRRLLDRTARAPAHPAAALRQALDRAAVRAGLEVGEAEDVSAVARRLVEAGHPLAGAYAQVAARYLEARFGGAPLREGELEQGERLLDRGARRAAHG